MRAAEGNVVKLLLREECIYEFHEVTVGSPKLNPNLTCGRFRVMVQGSFCETVGDVIEAEGHQTDPQPCLPQPLKRSHASVLKVSMGSFSHL